MNHGHLYPKVPRIATSHMCLTGSSPSKAGAMAGNPESVQQSAVGRSSRIAGHSVAREVAPLAGAIGAYGVLSAFLSTTTSLFLTSAVHAAPLLIGHS